MPAQIFGRDAELRTIGAFLGSLPRSPGALVLAGPAGAGKTTLLRAGAAAAAERGFTVLATTPSLSDLRLAFAGLSDLMEPSLGAVVGELPPPQAQALRVALLQETPAHPPEPRVIAAAFRTAVEVLARSAPVLIVIDDVQWLDPPSETAAGFAIRRLEHEPVGLLCAQRTERPGAQLPLDLGHARLRFDLLPVGGLSLGALHRLLRTRLGTSFSHPTLRRIEAGSGGNPFIALEIGRALDRRGMTSVGTAALPVPDTLSGLVAEHLGELPPAVLDAARLVTVMPDALIGQYLAAGAGGTDLDAAVLAGVLEPDGERLRFSHPLLAAAVAGSIPPARHRELHAIAARTAQRPEEQARHRALAAAGPSAPVAAELDQAARTAAGRGAPATAAELFGLAASLTPQDQPADARRRRLDAARELTLAGDTRAARASLEQLAASIPAGPERAEALSQLGWLHVDDFAAATALLEQALAEAGDDPARTAGIRFSLYEIWARRGDHLRARAAARQALADAERSGDRALLASCLAQACLADLLCGADVDRQQLERALELERSVGSLLLRTSPSQVAGVWHFVQGRLEEAEAAQRRALARAETDGLEYWRADMLLALSSTAGRRGDAAQAAQLAADGLQIAEQLGLPRPTITLLYGSASAALLLGQVQAVRDLAGKGMELAQSAGDRIYVIAHQALLGSLELALGDYPAAASWLRPLARQLLTAGLHPTTQNIAPDLAEALIAVGELDEAGVFLSELERRMRGPVTVALTARCHGALAAAHGNLDAAVMKLTEALRLHDLVSPQPLERGRTLLVLGIVQRRLKRRGAARATLSEALGIFEHISAPLWAARARAELARLSGRAASPEELSVTELRVAELVARGMTNRKVAAELFVTVRAVEATLTRAYAKLGVRSRTELAAHLHRGG
jgi:DNA-binding CsgD family transcriptional regulator